MLRQRFLALTALSLGACKVELADLLPTGPHTIVAHGITYTVPWEACRFNTNDAPLNYIGKSVEVAERDGRLIVNGKDYGAIGSGDEVNLMTEGKVIVNGKER
jgi:hypothetical protein